MYVCVEGKQVRCRRRDQVWMLFFFFVWSSNNIKDYPHRQFMICGPLHFSLLYAVGTP